MLFLNKSFLIHCYYEIHVNSACLQQTTVVIHLSYLLPVQYAKDTKQMEATVVYISMYMYFPKWSTPTIIITPIITVDGAMICKSNSDDQSLQQHLRFSVSEAFHFSPIKVMVCWLNTDWRLKECLLEVYRDGKDAFCCHLIFFSKILLPKDRQMHVFHVF